jgi:hypothetical protein
MGRIVSRIMAVAMAGWIGAASGEAHDRDSRITLKAEAGFPGVKGFVRYRDRGNERELRLEVEKSKLPKGDELEVRIDGKFVGTMTVNEAGTARFRARGGSIPVLAAGAVLVVQKKGGAAILTGAFR